jgi:hypothetical protein
MGAADTAADHWCGEWSAIPAPKKKKKTNPDIRTLIEYDVAVFEDLFNAKPQIEIKDAAAAKLLLIDRDLDAAKWIVREFLEEPPKWNADNRTLDLRFIPKAANTILARRK